jgi:hypothetical protein
MRNRYDRRKLGYSYLVGGITDADIKIWELSLHHVSKNDVQALLVWGGLESLGDFSSHTRIQFHGNTLLRLFEDLGRQVTSSGTNFKDDLNINYIALVFVNIINGPKNWNARRFA